MGARSLVKFATPLGQTRGKYPGCSPPLWTSGGNAAPGDPRGEASANQSFQTEASTRKQTGERAKRNIWTISEYIQKKPSASSAKGLCNRLAGVSMDRRSLFCKSLDRWVDYRDTGRFPKDLGGNIFALCYGGCRASWLSSRTSELLFGMRCGGLT
jgi:hypothetical protein